jgi:erythromycin esterase-like protein
MGRNLAWLTDVRFPKEKIIVWAASAHIARMKGNFPNWLRTPPTLGGEYMEDSLHRRESYSIGFCSREGKAGRLGWPVYDLAKIRKDGFERWMPDSLRFGFVDFSAYNAANPDGREQFFSTGYSHHEIRAIWNRVFDGMIYIKEMYPCAR